MAGNRKKGRADSGPALSSEESAFVARIGQKLSRSGRIRSPLPGWGHLHIDRALPFLCVYRRPAGQSDAGMDKLLAGEAAFLVVSGDRQANPLVTALLKKIVETLGPQFGAFLLLEVWAELDAVTAEGEPADSVDITPFFHVHFQKKAVLEPTLQTLEQSLHGFRLQKIAAVVEASPVKQMPAVHGALPLPVPGEIAGVSCHFMGLRLRPVFRNGERFDTCELFPSLFRQYRRGLSRAIRKTLFRFTESRTTQRPAHYQALGPRALTKLVWDVDHRLAGICDNFDYLFQVTPVNTHEAWLEFQRGDFQKDPVFVYRPLPYDPSELKRQLFQVPVEQVEDPALSFLFREKQEEMDRMISMLGDCNSHRFLHWSILAFGNVDDRLVALAERILEETGSRARPAGARVVEAEELAALAEAEISHYRRLNPAFSATVQIRDDVHVDFLVSRGDLFIGRRTQRPLNRVNALFQHEIGVHVLTHFNGHAQPFKLLGHGLAGYEELQEGLAVLAEYLVGGLTPDRLRILAARVLAVRAVVQGARFTETFRLLQTYGFAQPTAFQVAMRVHRGGGLTKDLLYLRGLDWLLGHLGKGNDLESLWIGKIGARHVTIIQELLWRKVIMPAPLSPRFLHELSARERMEKLRGGMTVMDLLESW